MAALFRRKSAIIPTNPIVPDYGGFPGIDNTGPVIVNGGTLQPLPDFPGQYTNGQGRGGQDPATGDWASEYSVYDAQGNLLGTNVTASINGTTSDYGYSYGTAIPPQIDLDNGSTFIPYPGSSYGGFPSPPTYSGFPAPPSYVGFPAPPSYGGFPGTVGSGTSYAAFPGVTYGGFPGAAAPRNYMDTFSYDPINPASPTKSTKGDDSTNPRGLGFGGHGGAAPIVPSSTAPTPAPSPTPSWKDQEVKTLQNEDPAGVFKGKGLHYGQGSVIPSSSGGVEVKLPVMTADGKKVGEEIVTFSNPDNIKRDYQPNSEFNHLYANAGASVGASGSQTPPIASTTATAGVKVPDWAKGLPGYKPGDKKVTVVNQGPNESSETFGYMDGKGNMVYRSGGNIVEDPNGPAKPHVIKKVDFGSPAATQGPTTNHPVNIISDNASNALRHDPAPRMPVSNSAAASSGVYTTPKVDGDFNAPSVVAAAPQSQTLSTTNVPVVSQELASRPAHASVPIIDETDFHTAVPVFINPVPPRPDVSPTSSLNNLSVDSNIRQIPGPGTNAHLSVE